MGDQFVRPVQLIWAAYNDYMQIPRSSRTQRVAERLQEQFGIRPWEWELLKKICDADEAGDQLAATVMTKVNDKKITLGVAHAALKRQQRARTVDPRRRVALKDVHVEVLRSVGFANRFATDLRNGVTVNTTGMSDEDIRDCIQQFRKAAFLNRQAADQLSRCLNGDTRHHGSARKTSRSAK